MQNNTEPPITLDEALYLRKKLEEIYFPNDDKKVVYDSKKVKQFLDIINSERVGIPKGTSPKQIGIKLEEWYEILKQQEVTTTTVPEYVSTTTLTPDQIANFDKDVERIKESEQIRADQKNVTERFEKRNKEIFAEQQRIQNEIKAAEAAKVKLAGKVVFAKVILPEPLPLDEIEQKDLEILRQHAQDESVPEKGGLTQKQILIETLANEIEVKIKPLMAGASEEVVMREARTLAVQIVKEIADPKTVIENKISSAIYYSISKDTQTIPQIITEDDDLLTIAKKGSTLILLDELEKSDFKHKVLQNLVGPNLAKAIEGPEFDEINVILSTSKTDDGFNEISFDSINTNYELSLKQKSELIDKVQEIGIDKTRDLISNSVGAPIRSIASEKIKVLQKAGKLPASPGLDGIFAKYGIGTSPEFTYKGFGEYVKRFAPETTPYWKLAQEVTGISFGIGVASNVIPLTFGGGIQVGKIVAIQQISIAKAPFTYAIATGNKIAIGAGAKAAGQVAVKAGLATTLSTTLAAWGASVPVPVLNAVLAAAGWAIGAVLGKIADKLKDWWTKNKDNLGPALAIGSGLGGTLAFGAGPGLGIGLVVAGATMGFGTLATGVFGVLGFIGRSIGIAIATPVIITLLIIPPLVAFIMLVINNSAYVVPPSNSLSEIGADNPYMLVTKIASPNKIDNPTSPQQVIYGVSIQALKESLFNVRITAVKCTVLKKDGKKMVCPDEDVPPLEEGKSISPSQVHAFSFISRYDARFNDSLVMDSIEVTAELADGTSVTTSGSASLCIGECPSNCAKTVDLADTWPPNIKAKADAGIAIMSQYFGFTAKACPDNKPINLCYKPSEINTGLYAWHIHNGKKDDCDVYFNSGAFGSNRNENDAAFIITHELTHHVQRINFLQYGLYMISGANNELKGQGLCTYSSTAGNTIGQQQEAMAESAALYVNSKPSWDACAANYSSKYPKSYNWAKKFMEE